MRAYTAWKTSFSKTPQSFATIMVSVIVLHYRKGPEQSKVQGQYFKRDSTYSPQTARKACVSVYVHECHKCLMWAGQDRQFQHARHISVEKRREFQKWCSIPVDEKEDIEKHKMLKNGLSAKTTK